MQATNLLICTPDQLPAPLLRDDLKTNPPELCIVADDNSARCSIWWTHVPEEPGQSVGLIGQFSASNASAAERVLNAACNELKTRGIDCVIGPMDGNTWKPYRFVSWQGSEPPFLLEPESPPEWPTYWQDAGFSPCYEYLSTIRRIPSEPDNKFDRIREDITAKGISIRSVDIANFETELRRLHTLSLESFKDNVLYTPQSEDDFVSQYLPFGDRIDPDVVLIAETHDGECCGFAFAYPDLLQLQRGEPLTRMVYKTLAISTAHRSIGLGGLLIDMIRQKSMAKGFTHEISALMHGDNHSRKICHGADVMRRYTLYRRDLG